MRMLWVLSFFLADGVFGANISEAPGALMYSDESDGAYNSLVFRNRDGRIVRAFDVGLKYGFYGDQLSPDKSYSVVNFSESGVLSGDGESKSYDIYLCAFVRMSDGCITAVESGEQCGGEWISPSRWVSPLGDGNESLFNSPPSIEKVLKDYNSGRKDRSQISNPKVMAYLLEGTSFQNLLVCDPPGVSNKSSYEEFQSKLRRDGDAVNAKALEDALGRSVRIKGSGSE